MRDPHLARLHARARANLREVEALFANYTPEQLTWRPAAERWSISECIDHLNSTGAAYHRQIEQAIQQKKPQPVEIIPPFTPGLFARFFIQKLVGESSLRLKTFSIFKPGQNEAPQQVFDHFLAVREEMFNLMRRVDGADLNHIKCTSPVTRLMRFSLGEAFWLLVEHQVRHINQARRITRLERFPKPGQQQSG